MKNLDGFLKIGDESGEKDDDLKLLHLIVEALKSVRDVSFFTTVEDVIRYTILDLTYKKFTTYFQRGPDRLLIYERCLTCTQLQSNITPYDETIIIHQLTLSSFTADICIFNETRKDSPEMYVPNVEHAIQELCAHRDGGVPLSDNCQSEDA